MATSDTNHLASLIQRKLEILTLLARLGRQQLALIAAGDMGMLMKLLAARQTMLGQLQELERRLDPFRGDDPDARTWPSAAARGDCQRQAAQCAERLCEILELEKMSERQMIRRRDDAAARLQGVHSAAEASHAYSARAIDPPSRAAWCEES